MSAIGLFFGSDEGHTAAVAEKIRDRFSDGEIDIHNIADADPEDIAGYTNLILGTPTWDNGGLQSDWELFWDNLYSIDFSGKTVALFGLGDQVGYAEYFLDAMGALNDAVAGQGATVIGQWPVDGYDFEESKALNAEGTHFVGLAVDEDTQDDMTDERVSAWVKQIQAAFS